MTTQTVNADAARLSSARRIETKLEVVVIPVSDVERSKRFYEGLGWRLDADFRNGNWRGIQLTPPGSPCSIIFGTNVTDSAPGSAQGLFLVVDDIAAARAELIAHGVEVSEVFHFDGPLKVVGTEGRATGPDPAHGSYRSWASFKDPDGNGWLLQEVTTRLPGRGLPLDVASLTALLREAEEHHGAYEATAAKHHWSGWYAAYIIAREQAKSSEDAAREAARHIESSRP